MPAVYFFTTHRSCFLSTVKMCKLIFISIGYATISVVAKALKSDNPPSTHVHQSASVLQAALHRIVPNVEHSHKNAALHISKNLMQQVRRFVLVVFFYFSLHLGYWSSSNIAYGREFTENSVGGWCGWVGLPCTARADPPTLLSPSNHEAT